VRIGEKVDALLNTHDLNYEQWFPRIQVDQEMCKLRCEQTAHQYIYAASEVEAIRVAEYYRDMWLAIEAGEQSLAQVYELRIDGQIDHVKSDDIISYVQTHYPHMVADFGAGNQISIKTPILQQIEDRSRYERKKG
jgi:hypothetical protein